MAINARLGEIATRRVEIRGLLTSGNEADLNKIEEELRALEAEETGLRKRLEMAQRIQNNEVETRVVTTTRKPETPEDRMVDRYDTAEYRKAFMDYVTRGVRSDKLEFRIDQTTELGDIGAVIPTTILNRIVEKMEESGRIWSRVTKTSVKGGVQIPVSSAKPVATWVAAGQMSDKQKKVVDDTIMFSYHKLQCRVAVELVTGTVVLPIFETTLSENIAEAMVKSFDEAILLGSGVGEPLGIAKDPSVPAGQSVSVAAADFSKYETWTKLMGKVPRKYRSGVVLIMNDGDWTSHIEGMVDANGQPVARVTYGLTGDAQERFLGREVIAIEDHLPSIDTADVGDVVAILVKLPDYMVNSNMAITYRRYFDEDKDEWVSKATTIADGKLADPNGVVLIKKK